MEKQEGCDPAAARIDDPWYDALASGWGEVDGEPGPVTVPAQHRADEDERLSPAEIYLEVHRSAAFQEVRRRYRRFVVPAAIAFFGWYLAYVITAVCAPGFMSRPVAGAVNVAMVAGLAQFLSTFLLTWAYARHARLRRDRAALELRWVVFEQNQQHRQHQRSGSTPDHRPGLNGRPGWNVQPGPNAQPGPNDRRSQGSYGNHSGRGSDSSQYDRSVDPGRGARQNDGQGTTRETNR
ncbi:DUF485 domain-containing protein [Streptomyces sp. ASQP_92]|uniref:DUF485 domain-containing protein n=1 Tax=Streptomyces sp. ASQP_92 TaxID=2979116 RepID=UPI0037D9BDCE